MVSGAIDVCFNVGLGATVVGHNSWPIIYDTRGNGKQCNATCLHLLARR